MKKRTLLILLIVAISILYLIIGFKIYNFIMSIKSAIKGWDKYTIYKEFGISLFIRPAIEILLLSAVAVIFTIITVALKNRERLTATSVCEFEQRKEKEKKKRQKKILQLTAKIEELNKKDDE